MASARSNARTVRRRPVRIFINQLLLANPAQCFVFLYFYELQLLVRVQQAVSWVRPKFFLSWAGFDQRFHSDLVRLYPTF